MILTNILLAVSVQCSHHGLVTLRLDVGPIAATQ